MATWLHSQLKAAEGLLEAVDRTAKVVKDNTSQKQLDNSDLKPGKTPHKRNLSSSVLLATEVEPPAADASSTTHSRSSSAEQPAAVPVPQAHEEQPSAFAAVANTAFTPIEASTQVPSQQSGQSSAAAGVGAVVQVPQVPAYKGSVEDFEGGDMLDSKPSGTASVASTEDVAPVVQLDTAGPVSKAGARRVVELELEEARKLAAQSGNAREARLQRVIERLRERLEQYKAENQELEEMLQQADAKYHGGAGAIEALEDRLAKAEVDRISAEAALSQTVSLKDSEITRLTAALTTAHEREKVLEGEVEALQHSKAVLHEKHQEDEHALLHTLRREVAVMEQRLRDEQAAHAASIHKAEVRQHELETTLADSAADLSAMQRQLDDRAQQVMQLRQQNSAATLQLETLKQQLREAGGDTGGASKQAAEAAQEVVTLRNQCQLLRKELETAQQQANTQIHALTEEVAQLQQQVAETSSSMELESRLKELSELLFHKQTQYERLAADKAAQQLSFQRQLKEAHEEADKLRRRSQINGRSSRLLAGSGISEFVLDNEVVPMDSLPAYYRLAEHKRVGPAVQAGARYIDMGTSTVVRVLRQYPLARVLIFLYILMIHLYCYFLLTHLQRHAMSLELSGSLMSEHMKAAAVAAGGSTQAQAGHLGVGQGKVLGDTSASSVAVDAAQKLVRTFL